MRHLVLILALVACAPAEAGPTHGPKHGPAMKPSGIPIPPPILLTDTAPRYAVLQYGQSPAGTSGSASALSTTQPYSNDRVTLTSLAACVETTSETCLSSTLNEITSIRAGENNLIGFTRFATDTAITDMSIGDAIYTQAVTQSLDMLTPAATGRLTAISFLQGETDVIDATPRATYVASMGALRSDFEASFAANGSLAPQGLAMFYRQTPGWTSYSATNTDVILAQLDRHENGLNRFFLVGPAYYLPFTDAVHTTAAGKQHEGMQMGKAIEATLWSGRGWEPLRPRRAIADGATLRVYYAVPCLRYLSGERCSASPPLALDTTIVSNRTNAHLAGTEGLYSGFRYVDAGTPGVSPRVSTPPAIAATCAECAFDEWRVDIVMSSEARSGAYLGYADISQTGSALGCTGHGLGAGCNAAGNLKDLDETTGWTGAYSLNNWAVASRTEISEGATPTQVTQIANATAMAIGGTAHWTVPDVPALDFTTEFSWFTIYRANTQVANDIIMSHATSGASQAFIIRQGTFADDIVWQFGSTSNYKRCDSCNLVTGTTYCLAGSYNGGRTGADRARIYLGRPGVSFSQPSNSQIGTIPASMAADTAALRFGYISATADVILDETALWNVALTEGQLRAICYGYGQDVTPDLENITDLPVPLAWYRHDGDGAGTVTDHIAGTYNGTTSGATSRVGDMAP